MKKWKVKKQKQAQRERELLTVQTHVMEGEDRRPAGGSCAVEGHMQDAMWGLNTVLLEREEVPGVSLKTFKRLLQVKIQNRV